jgi:transmembrane sensor
MDKSRLLDLLSKQENDTLNDRERNELESWYNSLSLTTSSMDEEDKLKEEMFFLFREKIKKPSSPFLVRTIGRRMLKIAAVVTGLFLGGVVYYMTNYKTASVKSADLPSTTNRTKEDVAPGTNRAILTLGDGSRINLDESDAGVLAQQGNVKVLKLADGTLGYRPPNKEESEADILYNTIITPRGGEYKLTLSDGSNVWLNASSSLRYPTSFAGSKRRVEVSGEAYFEVAKNTLMPFIVSVNGEQEVKVLGTHFNINAYTEEGPKKITLLEGSVIVAERNHSITLKPGQQSSLSENGFKVEETDLEQVIAWKTGFIEFDNSSLEAIMREISRWYDVDINYQGKPKTSVIFGGRISKRLPLSKVLKMLETYGVKAEIRNKEIIISE